MTRLQRAFDRHPVLVTFVTAGFPSMEVFPQVLLSLQRSGSGVIEVGVPFSDPTADGAVIQEASHVALRNGASLTTCLEWVRMARVLGLHVPVVLMGYTNPFLQGGDLGLLCAQAGVDGIIVVDLPPTEAPALIANLAVHRIAYVPLITPTTAHSRIPSLLRAASAFVYVVSVAGVTGARATVSDALPLLVAAVRKHTTLPLAVGFGVATREQFLKVAQHASAVVIGSAIVAVMRDAEPQFVCRDVEAFVAKILTGENEPQNLLRKHESTDKTIIMNQIHLKDKHSNQMESKNQEVLENNIQEVLENNIQEVLENNIQEVLENNIQEVLEGNIQEDLENMTLSNVLPSRFGKFGGQYAPEALIDCLLEIEEAFKLAIADPSFQAEIESHYPYASRPSNLHLAPRLTEYAQGASIYLKREDLNHTGSHKINNALAQVILAIRLGKTRIIAETGAGQHGVATATICAKFGMKCVIYMGAEDVRRQALNVFRIKLLGAQVIEVHAGSKTLKDAINEAMRDWVTNVKDTHYVIGSAIGPHPFPTMVREFQSCIGRETRLWFLEKTGKLPNVVVACVGGGSNAIGIFHPFINDAGVRLVGVEAAGDGIETGKHSATLSVGKPGVLHGTLTYLLQDNDGQIIETHSISAGLDYPGVGPEHSHLKDSSRAEYVTATDADSLRGVKLLSELEGIIPALETGNIQLNSAHAVFYATELAKTLPKSQTIVICVSGRGDKDVTTIAESLPKIGPLIGWDLRF